jgi:hypothetical protein
LAFSADGFDDAVARPPGLTIEQLRRAIKYVEETAEEWIDIHDEQANIFSAVIGILGVRALAISSPYKKHKHPDIAQQRFPDLSLGGRLDPPAKEALESKGSTRGWPIQSHYDHPGWYIVWRYVVDRTKQMKPGRVVVVWRVDIPFLDKSNWKYEKSGAQEGRGGRTHTFGVKSAASVVRKAIVYQAPGIRLYRGAPTLIDPTAHS